MRPAPPEGALPHGPLADLEAAVSFLTPLGRGQHVPSPLTMSYFPLAGAAIGVTVGFVWSAASRLLPPLPAAAVAIAGDAAVTGALHLDGLADAADGLLAHAPAKDRLQIMSAPDVGAFGSVVLQLNIVLRTAALASLRPSPTLLAAVYTASRSVMVLGCRLPYARPEGLASTFLPGTVPGHQSRGQTERAAVSGLAAAAVLAAAANGPRGLAAVAAGVASSTAVLALARRRVGGFTGDVLGAAGALCETVALVVVASGGRQQLRRRP